MIVGRAGSRMEPCVGRRLGISTRMFSAWYLLRVALAAMIVVAVAELSQRAPRLGALLLSLPLISILAMLFAWHQHHDLPALSRLARETIVLVCLGLPFFLPLAYSQRVGLGFWTSLLAGIVLAACCIGAWFALADRP